MTTELKPKCCSGTGEYPNGSVCMECDTAWNNRMANKRAESEPSKANKRQFLADAVKAHSDRAAKVHRPATPPSAQTVAQEREAISLTADQVEKARKLTLDYAIAIFEAKGARMVSTAWCIERLEEMKTFKIDPSVITNSAAPAQLSDEQVDAINNAIFWLEVEDRDDAADRLRALLSAAQGKESE